MRSTANGQGVVQDFTIAQSWFERAAAGGVPAAMYYAGLGYENGRGVVVDAAKARDWYEKAARAGDARAQVALRHL